MRSVQERIEWLTESNGGNCFFFIPLLVPEIVAGITAAVGALGATIPAALTAPLIGSIAATAPLDIGVGAAVGAAGGAALSGLTGGKPGLGALTGAIGGAATPFGGPLGEALGIGATAGDVLVGAGSGLLGAELTNQNPLTGTLTGAASGAITGLTAGLGGGAPTSGTSPSGVGPVSAPATTATPAASLAAVGSGAGSAPAFGDIAASGTLNLGPMPTEADFTGSAAGQAPISGGSTVSGGQITPGSGGQATGNIATTPTSATGNIATTGGGPTPDLSINQTPAAQSAQLGGMIEQMTPAGTDIQGPSFGDRIGNYFESLADNPLKLAGLALNAGMLGYEMFGGAKSAEQQDISQLQSAAAGASSMARALDAPLFSGVLPAGAQEALETSKQNQEAIEKSRYAAMGMSGSTGEADALAAIDQNIAAQQFGMETDLFGQAYNYSQLASQDYNAVIGAQEQMDANQAAALGRFVASIAGTLGGTPTRA
jgi:hypothetical protein